MIGILGAVTANIIALITLQSQANASAQNLKGLLFQSRLMYSILFDIICLDYANIVDCARTKYLVDCVDHCHYFAVNVQ